MSEHCEHAPSAFERIAACPASVQRSRGQPDLPSRYAIEGTRAHEIARIELERALGWHDDKERGIYEPDVDDEMRAAVDTYVEAVMAVCDPQADQVWVEQRVNLAPFNPPAPLWGTSDAILYKPLGAHLLIFDFKYGKGVPVEVRGNLQLRIYAGGALASFGADRPVKRVDLYVVQPRAAHALGPVRFEPMDAGDLMMDMAEVFVAQAKSLEPNPPAFPGDHCRWCPAAAHCPEYRERAMLVAGERFAALDAPLQTAAELAAPHELTDDELGTILNRARLFEAWLDQVRTYAHWRAEAGYQIPGWKLVPKRATRHWIDEQEAESTLRFSLGDAYELHTHKLKSPAQLEKEIGKKGVRAFHDLIIAESSGTTLAPDFDPRTSIVETKAQRAFPPLE